MGNRVARTEQARTEQARTEQARAHVADGLALGLQVAGGWEAAGPQQGNQEHDTLPRA